MQSIPLTTHDTASLRLLQHADVSCLLSDSRPDYTVGCFREASKRFLMAGNLDPTLWSLITQNHDLRRKNTHAYLPTYQQGDYIKSRAHSIKARIRANSTA